MEKPAKKNERIRLNLAITPEVQDRLTRLQELSGSESTTEVIRRALAVYDLLLTHIEQGGKVILRHEGGEEETVRILT